MSLCCIYPPHLKGWSLKTLCDIKPVGGWGALNYRITGLNQTDPQISWRPAKGRLTLQSAAVTLYLRVSLSFKC